MSEACSYAPYAHAAGCGLRECRPTGWRPVGLSDPRSACEGASWPTRVLRAPGYVRMPGFKRSSNRCIDHEHGLGQRDAQVPWNNRVALHMAWEQCWLFLGPDILWLAGIHRKWHRRR